METYHLDRDIKTFCVTAKSFPDGILAAHQKLHSLIGDNKDRLYFGFSRPEDGEILYRAAAEERTPGEAEALGLETFVLPKGLYICQVLTNINEDPDVIGRAFDELTSDPRIDPQGYCVEMYLSTDDVRCMVKLSPENQ